jgi:hypothetical protein
MRTEAELQDKWVQLGRTLRAEGPVTTQSETNHIRMQAQKELLEWVLS